MVEPKPCTDARLGLAARRSAQLPKLRNLIRRLRPESLDDPCNTESDLNFQYNDSDTMEQEMAELYSYSERDEFMDNYRCFMEYAQKRGISGWSSQSLTAKKNFIMSLFEELELSDASRRSAALQVMAYLLQGNFMDVVGDNAGNNGTKNAKNDANANVAADISEEESVVIINVVENAFLMYELGAWPALCTVLTLELENAPAPANPGGNEDSSAARTSLTLADCRTLRLILICLYTILESVRRADEAKVEDDELKQFPETYRTEAFRLLRLKECLVQELGQPINSADQTLPIILFDMMVRCCSHPAPHYPMRKTLLLLWKVLVTWLGGWNALKVMKEESRRRAGLTPCEDTLTVTSMMQAAPPPQLPLFLVGMSGGDGDITEVTSRRPPLTKRQLACAPVDSDYGFSEDDGDNGDYSSMASKEPVSPAGPREEAVNANDTPMPSRSHSPEPGGTNSETNMSKMQSKALPWTPKIRQKDVEQFLERERFKFFGFQLPDDGTTTAGLPEPINESLETLRKYIYVSLGDQQIEREVQLEKYTFSKAALESEVPDTPAEQLYRMMLPNIPRYIIGLLKFLLAAAPSSRAKPDGINLTAEIASTATNGDQAEPPDQGFIGLMDLHRHKEIIVKAISALLLLLLKHFKLNHIYQFEFVSRHMVFANCIPLILKFFDQNILQYIQKGNELKQLNFPACAIEYARLELEAASVGVKAASQSKFDTIDNIALEQASSTSNNCENQQTEFMWRNLFSAVNLLRILNKLTKWKHARTIMLVVFKSAPVLKRSLRVKHILLQLYALKLLKMQAKYLGRQWRKTNMELMSAIYNKVRHRLIDDWAYGNETQAKTWNFQAEEAILIIAVDKFNMRRYGNTLFVEGESPAQAQLRCLCSSQSDDEGLLTSSDNSAKTKLPFVFDPKDPEYQPFDNNVVSVLGVKYELTDNFKRLYTRWVEQEVTKAAIDWDQLLKCNC